MLHVYKLLISCRWQVKFVGVISRMDQNEHLRRLNRWNTITGYKVTPLRGKSKFFSSRGMRKFAI